MLAKIKVTQTFMHNYINPEDTDARNSQVVVLEASTTIKMRVFGREWRKIDETCSCLTANIVVFVMKMNAIDSRISI